MDTPVRVYFHRAQVREALDEPRFFSEFLGEGIAEVVCGVGGDEEDGLAVAGELNGEGAGGGGFTDTAFAADEDPAEGFLVDYGLEGWGQVVGVWVDVGGHGGVRW